jgi:hypothetical protein
MSLIGGIGREKVNIVRVKGKKNITRVQSKITPAKRKVNVC